MEDQLEQFRARLTVIKLIHLAMVAGVLLFGLVVILLIYNKMTFDLAYQNPVFIVAGGLAAINIAAASALHKIFFKGNGLPPDIGAAVQKYQVFILIRVALIEGAALFSAVVTLITYNVLALCLLALCAGALAVYRPSQREFSALMHKGAEGFG